jgi:biotin operon repressor
MNTKTIAWITGTLTLLLALFSFILSFNALTDLAARHNVSIPYLFPLVVEAGVVIFSLNALYRSIHDEHARWQWVLIIGSSLLAGTFNVLHAEVDLVSRIMAAMPSLFLLLSFESFLNQVKHGVKRSNLVHSLEQLTDELNTKRQELDKFIEQKRAELDNLVQSRQAEVGKLTKQAEELRRAVEQSQATLAQLQREIEQAKTVQGSSLEQARQSKAKQDRESIEQRRARLVNILGNEADIGVSSLANRLNTSRTTIYSDLDALSHEGLVRKNGNGWEVVR